MKKVLFIDTDLGGDCDDVGAVALANIFKNNDIIEIAGMTHTTSLPWGPACIEIINKFYNNDSIPIGATSRVNYCVENTNKFAEKMANAFSHTLKDREKVVDSVKFIRETLSNAEDNSITFVCIGQLNNASDLLDSSPDEISYLSGIELVRQKVKEFVIMGGLFKSDNEKIMFCGSEYNREYNILTDIKSAQNFIKKVPVKTIFSDFKVGYQIHTAKPLLDKKDMKHPVTFAYTLFQDCPRESWDLLAVWYAALEDETMFDVSNEGTIIIKDDAETIFDESQRSNHYYLRLNNSIEYIVNRIDNLLDGGKVYEKISN